MKIDGLSGLFSSLYSAQSAQSEAKKALNQAEAKTEAVQVAQNFGAQEGIKGRSEKVADLKSKYESGELTADSYDSTEVAKSLVSELF